MICYRHFLDQRGGSIKDICVLAIVDNIIDSQHSICYCCFCFVRIHCDNDSAAAAASILC